MSDIAIIGAGMAGLTAARLLVNHGREVRVYEKSRGTGGRLATRRSDAGAFDHGAPAAHGDPSFDAAMTALGAVRQGDGWRGTPGMSGLIKPLVPGIEIRGRTRVEALNYRDGWHLETADGTDGPFASLILAIPAPQAASLLPHPALDAVRVTARWTLMCRWPGLVPPEPDHPFASILPDEDARLVAHATEAWSARYLEFPPEEVAAKLVDALAGMAGSDTRPAFAQAHRWRYALTARPLGRPFLDAGDGCLIGGDWALGARAGDAWTSGREMAHAVLGSPATEG